MSKCSCKADLEKRLTERFIKMEPAAADHAVVLNGYALVFPTGLNGNFESKPSLEYAATAKFTSKKKVVRERTIKGSMLASFCPFCGVPLSSESKEVQP